MLNLIVFFLVATVAIILESCSIYLAYINFKERNFDIGFISVALSLIGLLLCIAFFPILVGLK
jgi:hypothetical protein